ncbi:hypothetical protein E2F50_05065 [Rhizobium deserti]|uniref:Uncharacterized protein n=1 Tax=Rhizobium deserti TaxID=2547961 RepID=A0A4R5UNK1_9HYPH|nr:DUF6665 family protein [Rhizobium deserti]TDK39485.1 hypothetical protein E2F50_05065 [Rhizobium deserti]
MAIRPPQAFHASRTAESGLGILEHELAAERASALGRHGQKLEASLARLRQWSAEGGQEDEATRLALVHDAADALWALFIQREVCGLRDNRDIVRRYGIPSEVLSKVGTVRSR